jgi:NAD(P)-dependent dehydrogenase (short-subunit alcohol dehydrogenase family)
MAEKIGNGTISMKMDVTQESDWKIGVDMCIEEFGRLDILVNNAGTSYKNKVSLKSGFSHGRDGFGTDFRHSPRWKLPKPNLIVCSMST